MSSGRFLEERERALEEVFFRKQDAKLIARLRAERERAQQRDALTHALGVKNMDLLDRVLDQGVRADTVVALALAPMVAVAWADRDVKAKERTALLDAARELGVRDSGPVFELLEHWLTERPSDRLLEAWCAYMQILCEQLRPADRDQLRQSVMRRARAVAKAAGGPLGLPLRTSAVERAVLDQIEGVFEQTGAGGAAS